MAGLAEDVPHADPPHRHGAPLREGLAHGAAQAADDGVLLHRDYPAGLRGGLRNEVRVERLHRVEVQDLAVDPLGGERLGGTVTSAPSRSTTPRPTSKR